MKSPILYTVYLMILRVSAYNLYLGGLAPTNTNSLLYYMYHVANMAVNDINSRSNILNGHTLRIRWKDTMDVPEGTEKRSYVVSQLDSLLKSTPQILMLLHEGDLTDTKATALLSGEANVLQMSTGTSDPELSDTDEYPYFFRTISSSSNENLVEVQLVKYLGISRVVLLTEDKQPFKMLGFDVDAKLRAAGIDVVDHIVFNDENMESAMERIEAAKASLVVGSYDYMTTTPKVFCWAYRKGIYGYKYTFTSGIQRPRNYTWQVMTFLKDNPLNCTVSQILDAMNGTFQWYRLTNVEAVQAGMSYPTETTVTGETPERLLQRMESIINRMILHRDRTNKFQLAYDAVWACALVLQERLQTEWNIRHMGNVTKEELRGLTKKFSESMKRLNFNGASGPVRFSSKGDRLVYLSVEQIQNGTAKFIGVFDEALNKFTKWMENRSTILDRAYSRYVQPRYDNPFHIIYIDRGLKLTYSVIGVGGMILIGLAVVYMFWQRRNSIIRQSWPIMNVLIYIGLALLEISTVLNGYAGSDVGNDPEYRKTAQRYCQTSIWLLVLGFTMAYGSMVVKMLGIIRFFKRRERGAVDTAEYKLFILTGIFLALDLLVLIIWQSTNPPIVTSIELAPKISENGVPLPVYIEKCTTDSGWMVGVLVYKGILLIMGILMIWPAWLVSGRSGIGDSQYVGLSMVLILIVAVISAPIAISLDENPSLEYGIVGGSLLATCIIITLLLIIPKIIAIHRGEGSASVLSPMSTLFSVFDTETRDIEPPNVVDTTATGPPEEQSDPTSESGTVGTNDIELQPSVNGTKY